MSAVVAYESASLTERQQYAQTLAAAGDLIPRGLWSPVQRPDGSMGPAAPSPGKVLLVIETGAMLGLHPAAALQSIDVVEGRASLSAQLTAALIRKAGHRLSIAKSGTIAAGDYAVTVTAVRADDGEEITATWDVHRALRAGLVDSFKKNAQGIWEVRARSKQGNPLPWEAYTETMLKWRAIAEVGREGFSDVTFGLYTTEEVRDMGPSLPVADPEPEASEDWPALIAAAASRAELDDIAERLKGEPDAVRAKTRAAWQARAGVLAREAETVDAEVVEDEPEAQADESGELSEADYEAQTAAEYEAAVERGEVQP
ncbi:hypothetical protein [Microbacterium sp. gxy059]|uniref:hypothetical protein n=1 Tax=Microbacterium sp. gxy059 TaxID=2957199 RepID=UPI003D98A7B0